MQPQSQLKPQAFNRIILAGGGNRCWWQAGVLQAWLAAGVSLPNRWAGVSAGAAIAAAHLSGSLARAEVACKTLYQQCDSIWTGWAHTPNGQRNGAFAHTVIYPAWVNGFFTERDLNQWVDSAELIISIARLPRWAAKPFEFLGIAAGIAIYALEKGAANQPHARWPQRVGFRNELTMIDRQTDFHAAQTLLLASAAAVPFAKARQWNGATAIDGGFADHAPQPTIGNEKQLVLLTRYRERPLVFEHQGRTYFQPSRPIPVSTWDCSFRCNIDDAIALGYADGKRVLATI